MIFSFFRANSREQLLANSIAMQDLITPQPIVDGSLSVHSLTPEIRHRLSLCPSISFDSDNNRLVIPYTSLKEQPYTLSNGDAFVRYRNYDPSAKAKYQSPAKYLVGKYDTPLYYPKKLRQQFQDGALQGNTIVLTEGEFKAISAVQNNINCVSFAGTSLYNHALAHIYELHALIQKIKIPTVNFVLLFDADAIDPFNKKGFTNTRLADFNRSARGFFKLLQSVAENTSKKVSIYLGYIDHEQKGLDDLLESVSLSEKRTIAYQVNSPKFCQSYFKLVPVTKRTINDKVNELFPSHHLQAFIDRYQEQLTGNFFTFKHQGKNGGAYTITYFLDENGILHAKDEFYTHFDSSFDATYTFDNYASEQIQSLLKTLQEQKKVLLCAPTGAGKTTLTQKLQPHFHRIILLEPTRAIAKQQKGFVLSIGGVKQTVELQEQSIVSTFAKLKQDGILTEMDFHQSLLVVDEAHEIYKSFGFRPGECSMIERLIRSFFQHVLATTATPVVPFFRALDFTCIEFKQNEAKKKEATVRIINTHYKKTCGGGVDYQKIIYDCVHRSRTNGRKAYIYHLSKDNHVINTYHKNNPFSSMLITGQSSRNEHQHTYNTMLRTGYAFVGDYDTLLTNSILETGASFQDENVDVYILFASDSDAITQACARFRNTDSINYFFYLKKQDWQSSKCQPPQNDLCSKAFEITKQVYDPHTYIDITTSLQGTTHTYHEAFSYCATFFHFEQNRIQGQPHTKLLGNLLKRFTIHNCKEIEPPRAEKIPIEGIKVSPKDLLEGIQMNTTLIGKVLLQLRKDQRQFAALQQFDDAIDLLEPKETVRDEQYFHLSRSAKDELKLVLFCVDLALKFKKNHAVVLHGLQRIKAFLKKQRRRIDPYLIQRCLLLQFLQQDKHAYKRINNRGKRQEWFHILQVIQRSNKAFHRFTIYDLWRNSYFKGRSERDLKRIIQSMNLWFDMVALELREKNAIIGEETVLNPKQTDIVLDPFNASFNRIRKKKALTVWDIPDRPLLNRPTKLLTG